MSEDIESPSWYEEILGELIAMGVVLGIIALIVGVSM